MCIVTTASLVRLAPVARGSFRPMGFIITDQVALRGAIVYTVRDMKDADGNFHTCVLIRKIHVFFIHLKKIKHKYENSIFLR